MMQNQKHFCLFLAAAFVFLFSLVAHAQQSSQDRAWALREKGSVLLEQKKYDAAIAVFEEVDRRFGQDASPEVRSHVVNALVERAIALEMQGRTSLALLACDEIDRRFGRDTFLIVRHQVVLALNRVKAKILFEQKKYDEAIEVYGVLIDRFGDDDYSRTRGQLLEATLNMGNAYGRKGEFDEAIELFEAMDRSYTENMATFDRTFVVDGQLGIMHPGHSLIVEALYAKSGMLLEQNKRAATIATLEEIERRFGQDTEPKVRHWVALARKFRANMN
ncbi:MAG: tetratricopeptide repeat protein [Zoogloeaceae bacterium]|nr:tetratricopeptide repeat protein [Zoogloeaceae bacterium]